MSYKATESRVKLKNLFSLSHMVYITPLVINALGSGHTDTHTTHTDTHTHTHTHTPTCEPKQFQETRHTWATGLHVPGLKMKL